MATPANQPARARAAIRITALAALAACGGGGKGDAAVTTPRTTSTTEDLSIEMGPITLEGTTFVPEGLPPPPMLMVRPSKRTTLDKQRAAWKKVAADARAPLTRKATEAQVLATLIFERLGGMTPDAPTYGALLAEARAALAAVLEAAKGEADRATLEMAAALAIAAGDGAGATPHLQELVTRFPDSDASGVARAQLAFAQLVAGKDADAAAVVADRDPADGPELAYVLAWVRFRAGDGPGAAAAITTAAAGWKDATTRPALIRDYLIMTSRGGVEPAAAADGLAPLVPEAGARAGVLVDLARAYELAGHADDADAMIELAVERAGTSLSPPDLVAVRRLGAEFARKAGRVAELPERWRRVATALERCADCAADVRTAVAGELAQRAYEQHTVFLTSGDARRRAAAAELYRIHAGLGVTGPGADDAAVAAHARELEAARAPEDGSQYHEAISAPLVARFQEVLACYEVRLQGERTLGGALTVKLEVDQAGAVTGVATEPPRGLSGMAAVAACVDDRARAWALPSRARPGTARITLPFVLGAMR